MKKQDMVAQIKPNKRAIQASLKIMGMPTAAMIKTWASINSLGKSISVGAFVFVTLFWVDTLI